MPDGAAGQGTPTSGRHSGPQGRGRLIAVRLHGAQAWGPQRCERCLPFQCTDHAERWDSRREGTTSQLGVLPAARLRRAVPAPTGRTGQRSAFPCLRVAPPGGLGAVRHVQRPRGAFCDSASVSEVEKSGRTVSAIPMYGSRRTLGFPPRRNHLATGGPSRRPPTAGCAGPHRENWPEVGVPGPAGRLR